MSTLKPLMLAAPRLTLSVAESLTCGQVQAAIGLISGASGFFLGGITAYTLEQKVKHLGVDRAQAAAVNCVSSEIAAHMARGACGLFGSDLALATTGYAEPSPEQGAAVPFAWWALAHRRRGEDFLVQTGRVECPGETRVAVQAKVTDAVLTALVTYLQGLRGAR